jgi:O-antigen ligase
MRAAVIPIAVAVGQQDDSLDYQSEGMSEGDAVRLPGIVLVVLMFALSVLPGLVQKIMAGARQQAVGQSVDLVPAAAATQYLAGGAVLFVSLVAVFRSLPQWMNVRNAGILLTILALWAYVVVNDVSLHIPPTVLAVVFPLVVLAIWSLQPSVLLFRTVGVCGGVAAGLSLILGWWLPRAGLYVNNVGVSTYSDKGLLPGPPLTGVFTSTNNLGQFLCLCLPGALMLKSRRLRCLCAGCVVPAVVWTGSRSSIAAAVVVLLIYALGSGTALRGIRWMALRSVVAVSIVGCVVLPFVARSDWNALSGRGVIWSISLSAWESRPWRGLGSRWFVEAAGMQSGFGSRSQYLVFHGHNQFVQMLVTGGLVAASVFLVVAYRLWRAGRGNRSNAWVANAYVAGFFVSGTLELNLGIVDRFQFYSTALIPVLILLAADAEKDDGRRLAEKRLGSRAVTRYSLIGRDSRAAARRNFSIN